jgi:iron complex outermembrane recepter protein
MKDAWEYAVNAEPPPELVVVITAPRLPDSAGNAAFSIIQVDPAQLADAPELDAALRSVAGFSLYRRTSTFGANPTTQGASLRAIAGSAASRALVTLDGVPQNDPFGGWVIWTALPAQTIGRAEIVRGAGAGPYGAGALTGVVGLQSRADLDGAEAEASAGSLGYREGLGVVGGKVGDTRVLAEAGAQHLGGWIPILQGRGAADRPLSLDAYDASVRVEEQAGRVSIAERVAAYDENRGSGVVSALAKSKGVQGSITAAAQPDGSSLGWRMQGWVSASNLVNTSASVTNSRNTSTPADDQYATPALGWGLNAAVRQTAGNVNLEIGTDVRGVTGESRERYTWVGGAFTKARKAGGQTLLAGLYAEGSTTLSGWLLTGGVRADYWGDFSAERVESALSTGAATLNERPPAKDGVLPTARFGARHDLGHGFAWRAAAYAGFRSVTLNELYRPFRQGNNDTEANPALRPEKLYGVETGLDYSNAAGLKLTTTVFRNQLVDPVINATIGYGPATFPIAGFIPAGGVLRERENVGEIDATGLEADAAQALGGGFSLTGSLAWTDSRVDGGSKAPQLDGKRPALTPKLTADAGVRWAPNAAFSVLIDGRYESARYDDDLNTMRLRSAVTADLRADWRLRPGLAAFLAIDNLFDTKVQTDQVVGGPYSYDAPTIVRVGIRVAT